MRYKYRDFPHFDGEEQAGKLSCFFKFHMLRQKERLLHAFRVHTGPCQHAWVFVHTTYSHFFHYKITPWSCKLEVHNIGLRGTTVSRHR